MGQKNEKKFMVLKIIAFERATANSHRNQVGNCRWKFTAFERKNTVFVFYFKIEDCNETIDQKFSDLKAKSNVRMKHFKDKTTGVC